MAKREKLKWWNMLEQRVSYKGNPNIELMKNTDAKRKEQRKREQFKRKVKG